MKISILTPTYNRGKLLERLYQSLIQNSQNQIEIQWLIMDDGSTDATKAIVQKWQEEKKIPIYYFWQENQGKMRALNQLVEKATGELLIECDSDDYFMPDAFRMIKEVYEKEAKQAKNIYGMCFLKLDKHRNNMGNLFQKKKTTMFDLYFKQKEQGEKCLVFKTEIRKKYKHQLEKQEKFVTEARMYHQMDLDYQMLCSNQPIMICEYQKDGYSKNIKKQFQENPYGYFEYFKEIFDQDMKNVTWKKRLYVIKHYILFTCLTKAKQARKNIKGMGNKILYDILYLPGKWKTRIDFK